MRSCLLKTIGCIAVSLTTLTISAIAQNQSAQPDSKTVWDGVFSEAQAQRGRTSYNKSCSGCHRPDLGGFEGVLRGQKFMDHWREDSLDSLFSNISRSMPRSDPGSLDA